jgi:hypothetical protein
MSCVCAGRPVEASGRLALVQLLLAGWVSVARAAAAAGMLPAHGGPLPNWRHVIKHRLLEDGIDLLCGMVKGNDGEAGVGDAAHTAAVEEAAAVGDAAADALEEVLERGPELATTAAVAGAEGDDGAPPPPAHTGDVRASFDCSDSRLDFAAQLSVVCWESLWGSHAGLAAGRACAQAEVYGEGVDDDALQGEGRRC